MLKDYPLRGWQRSLMEVALTALFNTLSSVQSLRDTDAARGKATLTDLTRFQRAALSQTRAPWTTLGGELKLRPPPDYRQKPHASRISLSWTS